MFKSETKQPNPTKQPSPTPRYARYTPEQEKTIQRMNETSMKDHNSNIKRYNSNADRYNRLDENKFFIFKTVNGANIVTINVPYITGNISDNYITFDVSMFGSCYIESDHYNETNSTSQLSNITTLLNTPRLVVLENSVIDSKWSGYEFIRTYADNRVQLAIYPEHTFNIKLLDNTLYSFMVDCSYSAALEQLVNSVVGQNESSTKES